MDSYLTGASRVTEAPSATYSNVKDMVRTKSLSFLLCTRVCNMYMLRYCMLMLNRRLHVDAYASTGP